MRYRSLKLRRIAAVCAFQKSTCRSSFWKSLFTIAHRSPLEPCPCPAGWLPFTDPVKRGLAAITSRSYRFFCHAQPVINKRGRSVW